MSTARLFKNLVFIGILCACTDGYGQDHIAQLQTEAMNDGKSPLGYWGTNPNKYNGWTSHSNRLIPVYLFGADPSQKFVNLNDFTGSNSKYRSTAQIRRIFGYVPERTVNAEATYMDQTDIAEIQRAAAASGRKYIFLVVFDGMDWVTTRAAAIYNSNDVTYSEGKGTGTHFQTYAANGTAQFGFMVTSPHNNGTSKNVDQQTVCDPGGTMFGGYDASVAGAFPWETPTDPGYLIQKPAAGNLKHAYPDSASSATSMTAGIKTYNAAIAVGPAGEQVSTVAHELQSEGWAVGVVSSVPISHATPAAAYAHNVSRNDYQDISRDLLGLPSVSHPNIPLPGMDVVIGGGFGTIAKEDSDGNQGRNFEPGNLYLADSDLKRVAIRHSGKYVTSVRRDGEPGPQRLARAAAKASREGHRLLGFYGVGKYKGHLPYQTANGDYTPVEGATTDKELTPERYTVQDVHENPTLVDMTTAALKVLSSRQDRFWLMVESGDVDWANHDNNIDNSIGTVNSGDVAVKAITDWVETNSNWNESLLIVTADHGHLFCLTQPELLVTTDEPAPASGSIEE